LRKKDEVPAKQYDGPCKKLLEFMQDHNFSPPEDWKGYKSPDSGH